MIIFFSEEILDSDVGLWVSGDGLLLAYSSFNDTSVREHTVNGFSPNTKVREHLQHIVVDISVKAGGGVYIYSTFNNTNVRENTVQGFSLNTKVEDHVKISLRTYTLRRAGGGGVEL